MARMLINDKNKKFIVKEDTDELHTNYGLIKNLKKAKLGKTVKSNTGHEFTLVKADFVDLYRKIKRKAQIIPLKDIGLIITETGLNRDSILIEAGSGSGALGCFLAKICSKVYSYEIREDFYNLVKKNIKYLSIENLVLKNKDAKKGFNEKNVDVVILDLPDPWELIKVAKKSLKIGGFLVSYSPTTPQVMDFVNNLDDSFIHLKTAEIIEREWEVKGRKVRPKSQAIGHSGFLSFARRVK